MKPADIVWVTIDGSLHKVSDKEELELGHRGAGGIAVPQDDGTFSVPPRPAHRYHCGCGLTVDCPDDELDQARWNQSTSGGNGCLLCVGASPP